MWRKIIIRKSNVKEEDNLRRINVEEDTKVGTKKCKQIAT